MTFKNNRAPLLCCFKLCASFHSHQWFQTKVTVRKCSIRVKIDDFFAPFDLEIWQMTLKNKRAPLLCCFKLCASFHSHWWIQTWVTVRKRPIWVNISDFFPVWPWNLTDDLENNRAPLLSNMKLYASFHDHMWIKIGVTVRKRLSWVMTSVTLTLDPRPWPFAWWTSLLSLVITPENFIMIRRWEHIVQAEGAKNVQIVIKAWNLVQMSIGPCWSLLEVESRKKHHPLATVAMDAFTLVTAIQILYANTIHSHHAACWYTLSFDVSKWYLIYMYLI